MADPRDHLPAEPSSVMVDEPPRARRSPALLQRRIRDLHLYLGMLFAPALLFFAATGALQLFNLHEEKPGRGFQPPAFIQELGMVHKKQAFGLPRHRPAGPPGAAARHDAPAGAAQHGADRQSGWNVLALKIFFLLASLGLFVSTCLGVWLGLRATRQRGLSLGLLFAGAAVPVLLLMMG